MRHASMLRLVALTGYGTRYLRAEADLETWYRHGVFHDARLLFRTLDNTLLADDFTLWLSKLKEAGAVRLSLHLAAELDPNAAPPAVAKEYVLVVHYPDRHEPWVAGVERAVWDEGLAPWDYPDAAVYGGEVDTYWRAEAKAGPLAVPDTDWKALAAAIAADLKIAVPSGKVPDGPYLVPYAERWAALPLFPTSPDAMLAHRVLATLEHEQAKFSNDTNPKNENSYYKHLDEQAAAETDAWGKRLDGWIAEVLRRCANEGRGMGAARWKTFEAEKPETPRAVAEPIRAGDEVTAAAAGSRWPGRVAFVLMAAVFTGLIVALSHLVAGFPWAAIVIGLVAAAYLRDNK